MLLEEDIAYCHKLEPAPSIFLVRDSGFATICWHQNTHKSVDHCTGQHRDVFNLDGKDIIMVIQCSSYVSPRVPSEATSEYLKAEWRATNSFELGSILSIQRTAMLAGFIEELTHLLPDSRSVVATRYDGFHLVCRFSPCFFLRLPRSTPIV